VAGSTAQTACPSDIIYYIRYYKMCYMVAYIADYSVVPFSPRQVELER
jgi:hypothetical protein